MGFLSATQSISRYHILDTFDTEPMEQVRNGLIQHAIPKMENEYEEISAGWTPFESPYLPDFNKFSFVFGSYFLFSLRIDKKTIPAKLVHKQMAIEIEKKKADSGRDFISKNEKSEIKETIMDVLMHKMPSIPNVYDVLWDYDAKTLFLLTTQKAANEFFETIFFKSFQLKPVRLFPYTLVETKSAFSSAQKDRILTLTPLHFSR
ncbi:MAG: recombination-associated protein RdgC [Desulfotignum sp.]|nr:recombination-associated protein RdgC [Desulfotignum sp.]MCF8087135.1 recombination-associated protein RdgC [Desulfotignum sp.]MCF8138014.1 recombination-associated protein RdgC [Desulfotignum sp.]